jgi:hypothetical protein
MHRLAREFIASRFEVNWIEIALGIELAGFFSLKHEPIARNQGVVEVWKLNLAINTAAG